MENVKPAVRSDWQTEKMPLLRTRYRIRMHFTSGQMECLRLGHIPMEMEDKWFWYMEGDTLYAHRSWTGYCIYEMKFRQGSDVIVVTANRDPKQYTAPGLREDKKTASTLLGWWRQENYDYYHEWLDETTRMLENK